MHRTSQKKHALTFCMALLCAAAPLMAGGGASAQGQAMISARPATVPVRAITNFDAAQRCVDEALMRNDTFRDVHLVVGPLDDPTNKVGMATRDMILTAASRMSERSRFFTIETADPEKLGSRAKGITLVVKGSITEFDDQVMGRSKDIGAGMRKENGIGGGISGTNGDSIIGLTLYFTDLNGMVQSGTIQPLRMVLSRRERGGFLTASLGGAFGSVELSFSRSEGVYQVVRALVDLAMIQAVGGYAQVPVSACLSIPQANPAMAVEARQRFDKMKPPQRLAAIAAALSTQGLYSDPGPARRDEALHQAIVDFQVSAGMPPLGQPDFDVYYRLMQPKYGVPAGVAPARTEVGPAVRVSRSNAGFAQTDYPITTPDSRLGFTVTVAEPAYLYCIYTDSDHQSFKVYPNPGSPPRRIAQGEVVNIPGENAGFAIKSGRPMAEEHLSCMASARPLEERLAFLGKPPPAQLKGADYQEILDRAREIDANLSTDTLAYDVCPDMPGAFKLPKGAVLCTGRPH